MVVVLEKELKTSSLICPNNAKKLSSIIFEALSKEKKVILDFKNIKTISLAFLYLSFKDLKKDYKGNLKNIIVVKNPTSFLFEEIEYLKKNYKELAKKFSRIELEYSFG